MNKNDSGRVLFVVLNFNGWQETLACVPTILAQTYKDFHILLIDNGSHDESLKKLTQYEDHISITFIKQPVNLGFSGGVNLGIRHAIKNGYEYTVLLNNDATLSKNWLETLLGSMKKTGASITTGLLLESSVKKNESNGDTYSRWGLPFPLQRVENVSAARDSELVFGVTAGASLYKT